jgi:RNA polymerase sigma-70 factor (ECF subfamily)
VSVEEGVQLDALDPDAVVRLVQGHDPRLRRLASRLLADRHRVDDVLQEAYVKAFRSRGTFQGGADLGTWLYRITYNCCIDELRRASRRPLPVDSPPEPAAPGSDPGHRVAVRQAVQAALTMLPPDQRAAVLLVDGEDLDYEHAALVLGVPRGTVASRVARGRQALRTALSMEEAG